MVRINENTRISAVLKQHPDALDAIVRLSPRFEKLRNPLLRKLMAGRTSLKEAAGIGHCSMKDIVSALQPLGFVFEDTNPNQTEASISLPLFINQSDSLMIKMLDVREMLAEGKDPLKMIMAAVKDLPAGHVLQLINTFEPVPLIRLLKNKGYESYVRQVSDEEFHTYFKLQATKNEELVENGPEMRSWDEFQERLASFGRKVTALDVSGMEMPMPMVTILQSMEQLKEGYVLSVQHKRVPVFLFNELQERKYGYLLHKAGDADIKLLIWKILNR